MDTVPWPLQKIIDTENALQANGSSGASTGEQIAAALVLNRQGRTISPTVSAT